MSLLTSGDGGLFSPEPTEHFITVEEREREVSIEIGVGINVGIYIYYNPGTQLVSTERSRCAYLPPLTCLCQK